MTRWPHTSQETSGATSQGRSDATSERASKTAFADRLAAYRALVQPVLLGAVPDKEPRAPLYDLVRAVLARAGKGLRPALCLATCAAHGGRVEDALPSAAALELLHNAFLVHDDVEDGSELRRDLPTLHASHGVPLAVNTGDAMIALTFRLLKQNVAQLGVAQTWRVLEELDHLLVESLEGQAMELGWVRDNDCTIGEDDYLRLVLKKTCWYSFIHPCRIGALVAGQDPQTLGRFDSFGFLLGAAFQIQDDILNLIGDERAYGKEIGGDLWEGKRTLILAHLFRSVSSGESERLREILGQPRPSRRPADIDWMYGLIGRYGSLDHAQDAARRLSAAAAVAFEEAFEDGRDGADRTFVRQLVDYVVERNV